MTTFGKKWLSVLLVLCMLCSTFLSACGGQKSDEELIMDRIEQFRSAYNNGDFEGAIACLEPKTRNAIEAMFNIAGGILGTWVGTGINLSDWFSLGVGVVPEGDPMALKISSVDMRGETAYVYAQMGFDAFALERAIDVTFVMVKEGGDWFIKDINDKNVTPPSDNQGSGGNNDGVISSGNGSNAGQNNEIVQTKWSSFEDGRAWIKYKKNDEVYQGLIDTQGNILYHQEDDYSSYQSIGNGAGFVYKNSVYKLIDKQGKVTATFDGDFDSIEAAGNGMALVYKYKSSITSVEHLYGVIDSTGKWKHPLKTWSDQKSGTVYHAGEGMFYIGVGYNLGVVYNAATGTCFYIGGDLNGRIEFENSVFYHFGSKWDDVYINQHPMEDRNDGDCVSGCFVLNKDGTYKELPDYEYKWATNGKLIQEEGEHLTIFDVKKNTKTSFTKYPASMVRGVEFFGTHGIVRMYGVDGKYYFTLINEKGETLYDAISYNSWRSQPEYADGNVLYCDESGEYCIVDTQGRVVAEDIVSYSVSSFEDGIGIASTGWDSASWYINTKGEKVLTVLKEK